jgi:hypothetical protein
MRETISNEPSFVPLLIVMERKRWTANYRTRADGPVLRTSGVRIDGCAGFTRRQNGAMSFLPSDEERDWLGRSLRDLIRAGGIAQFVAVPLLTPSDDDFPDPWDGSVRAAHRITQRLMHHAGIGDLRISLTAFPDDEPAADEGWDAGTAGWFSGIEAGRARFGIEPKEIGDPDFVAGIMAHEVAHAWRQKHEFIDPERDVEEHLTDLTTVFLGFGILTANATERYRCWRTSHATAHQTKSMGYLPAPAMSWLLALQASVRGDKTELAALRRYFEPNQKRWLDEAMEEIAANPRYLDALKLPPRETWPRFVPPPSVTIVDPRPGEVREAPSASESGETTPNAGQTAYRIESSRPSTRLFVGAWLGAMAGRAAVASPLTYPSAASFFASSASIASGVTNAPPTCAMALRALAYARRSRSMTFVFSFASFFRS